MRADDFKDEYNGNESLPGFKMENLKGLIMANKMESFRLRRVAPGLPSVARLP